MQGVVHPPAQELKYEEMVEYYTWNTEHKIWKRRARGKRCTDVVARMRHVLLCIHTEETSTCACSEQRRPLLHSGCPVL